MVTKIIECTHCSWEIRFGFGGGDVVVVAVAAQGWMSTLAFESLQTQPCSLAVSSCVDPAVCPVSQVGPQTGREARAFRFLILQKQWHTSHSPDFSGRVSAMEAHRQKTWSVS